MFWMRRWTGWNIFIFFLYKRIENLEGHNRTKTWTKEKKRNNTKLYSYFVNTLLTTTSTLKNNNKEWIIYLLIYWFISVIRTTSTDTLIQKEANEIE